MLRLRVRLVPARRARRPRAAPRRRAARAAVLWGAAAAALAHLALAVALETVLPQVRDPQYGHRQLRAAERQRESPDRPLVLALGTSRTQNAIDPAAMGFPDEPGSPLVFNGGLAGSWPVHLRLAYRQFRAAGIRPAAVLVELFPPALAVPGPADEVSAGRVRSLTAADLGLLGPYLDDPAALRHRWALSRANSWHEQRQFVVGHLAPGWQPWPARLDYQWEMLDRNGFIRYPTELLTDDVRERRRSKERASYEHVARDLRVSAFAERATRDLVADCRAEGVAAAFYLTPESPEFRSWYAPQSRAAVAAFARALSEELGCPVFEAPPDYAEEDFADGHHMLPAAAARFSRWLADTHLRPWLAALGRPGGGRP